MKSLTVPILLLASVFAQMPSVISAGPKLADNVSTKKVPQIIKTTEGPPSVKYAATSAQGTPAAVLPSNKPTTQAPTTVKTTPVASVAPKQAQGSSFNLIACSEKDRTANCDKVPYNAVCGRKQNKKLVSYVSGCIACQDKEVEGYMDRECPAFHIDHLKEGKTEYVCRKKDRDVKCQMKADQVCATLDNGSQKTFANSCSACWQSDVVKIKKGQCANHKIAYNYGLCSTQQSKGLKCRIGNKKVCGFPDKDVPAEFDSPCWSCKEWGVVGYLNGKCQAYVKKCSDKRVACDKATKVRGCVFEEGKRPQQVEDARCCTGTTHASYLVGNCPPSLPALSKNSTKCWDEFFPKTCPQNDEPVCATKTDGTKLTAKNSCVACVNENAYSFVAGSCPK